MKKLLLFILCLKCICSYGQILNAYFYKEESTGIISFLIENPTQYAIPVSWRAVNFDKKQEKNHSVVMHPYSRLTIGPNIGWWWEKGECMIVISDYLKETFWCPWTDPYLLSSRRYNVPFRSNDIHSSCNIDKHKCSFGIDANSDGYCDNCKQNGYNCHMVKH